MKLKKFIVLGLTLICSLVVNEVVAQKFVEKIDITNEKATIEFIDNPNMAYLMEIGGPGSYYWRKQITNEKELALKALSETGKAMPTGQYTIQITPIFLMTPDERAKMRELSESGDMEAIGAFRADMGIPLDVEFYQYNFHVRNGQFVNPDLVEEPMKTPGATANLAEHEGIYASLSKKLDYSQNFTGRAWDKTYKEMDQLILDDLIVDGSACIGQDCVNGESFGFDTIRLKENNLRIKAQDTSTSASFPTRDWQITFNESSNGGKNKFSIDDIDGGRTPFTIEAGAPSHSLYVEDGGRIGLGTSTPVADIHIKSGNTPTVRIEQDGTSGFAAQTWDIAGNETNFFVRDASNGSDLPFRIFPNPGSDALVIEGGTGDIGIGTTSPSANLHVLGASNTSETLFKGTSGTQNDPFFAVVSGSTAGGGYVLLPNTNGSVVTGGSTMGRLRTNGATGDLEYDNGTGFAAVGGGGGSSVWSTSGSNAFYSAGKVGIGSSTFGTETFLVQFNSSDPGVIIENTSASNKTMAIKNSGGGDINFHMMEGATRRAAIGYDITNNLFGFANLEYSSQQFSLRINSDGSLSYHNGSTGNKLFEVTVGGVLNNCGAVNANAFSCSSDRRFKQNIQPLEASLRKVLQLKGVTYEWNRVDFPTRNFEEGLEYGFIAQEVEAIFPELVNTNESGYKSVEYNKVTPILVEAIKEQQSIIDAQQEEINALNAQVAELNDLKAQVAQLAELVLKQEETSEESVEVSEKE